MQTLKLEVTESQVVALVRRLSPDGKRAVLQALIPRLDEMESITERGEQRMRELSADRGLEWDSLSEEEREHLVDDLLHEA